MNDSSSAAIIVLSVSLALSLFVNSIILTNYFTQRTAEEIETINKSKAEKDVDCNVAQQSGYCKKILVS